MENTLKSCSVVIPNIDLALLKVQKRQLIGIPKNRLTKAQFSALEGITCLLDAIQDYAVDTLGFLPEDVFNLSE